MNKIKLVGILVVVFMVFGLAVSFAKADDKSSYEGSRGSQVTSEQDKEDVGDNEDSHPGDNIKNQDKENDQDENIDEDKNDKDESSDTEKDEIDTEEHKSVVSDFVQGLLNVADKEKGTRGEQIKNIAKEQDGNKNDIADKIEKIKERSKFKTFLIGTDYRTIGQLRSEIAKTDNQIEQLSKIVDQTTNVDTKKVLQDQISNLKQQQAKVTNFLDVNAQKFSLFGWFAKMFE